MGYQQKRKRDDHHEFRPQLNPVDQQKFHLRRAIAELGEPSRRKVGEVIESVANDLAHLPEEVYAPVIQTLKAVVYEQPHKIYFLSLVIELLNRQKPSFAAVIVEMVHEELSHSIETGDYDRLKLFLRFACALNPILAEPGVNDLLVKLIDIASALNSQAGDYLYSSVVYAVLYLDTPPQPELEEKLLSYVPGSEPSPDSELFFGDDAPYVPQSKILLVIEAVKNLKQNGWNKDFMTDKTSLDLPALTIAEPNGAAPDTEIQETQETREIPPAESTVEEASQEPQELQENQKEEREDKEEKEKKEEKEEKEEETARSDPEPAEETQNEDQEKEEPTEEVDSVLKEETTEVKEENGHTETEATTSPKPLWETHRLPAVHLPETLPPPQRSDNPGEWFTRIYLPTVRETVPKPDDIFGLLLRDIATDNIRHLDFNRREVTRQLITLDLFFNPASFAPPGVSLDVVAEYAPDQATWKVEDVALEAVLAQSLSLPKQEFPTVYFDTILIEACIMAPQAIAPVLGRALRFLFAHCDSLDAEILFRVVDWFSHHVSNFAFTWKWNEWVSSLELPTNHPKQVFMRELLSKQVRLSYPQRVRDALPAEFVDKVPDIPDPPAFIYENNSQINELQEALQSGNESRVTEILDELYQQDEKLSPDPLITVICNLGNRSLSHISTWLEKTAELIKKYVDDDRKVIDAVLQYRHDTVWIGVLILEEFAAKEVITVQSIVDAIVENKDLLLSSAGWETLLKHSEQANARADSLSSLETEDEWDQWWRLRLSRALKRRFINSN